MFDSMNAEELGPSRVEAYGGGFSSDNNAAIGWCQLGGDGTILKLQHTTKEDGGLDGSEEQDRAGDGKTLLSTLLIKGSSSTLWSGEANPDLRVHSHIRANVKRCSVSPRIPGTCFRKWGSNSLRISNPAEGTYIA